MDRFPEITPEEALCITSDPSAIAASSAMAVTTAMQEPELSAGLMLAFTEIMNGDCQCRGCDSVRTCAATFFTKFDSNFGGPDTRLRDA